MSKILILSFFIISDVVAGFMPADVNADVIRTPSLRGALQSRILSHNPLSLGQILDQCHIVIGSGIQ